MLLIKCSTCNIPQPIQSRTKKRNVRAISRGTSCFVKQAVSGAGQVPSLQSGRFILLAINHSERIIRVNDPAFSSNPLNGRAAKPPVTPISDNRNAPHTGQAAANAPAAPPRIVPDWSFIVSFFVLRKRYTANATLTPNKITVAMVVVVYVHIYTVSILVL